VKEPLAEVHTGERIFCYSNHMKGHKMKDSLIMTHMYWSDLYCVVELQLPGLHREKETKKKKKSSGSVLLLLSVSVDSGRLAE